jgi:TetR/AcrR family transcriptional regulator
MQIKSRKEREKEQRKKDILDSAEKLFFERGYDNVSMNDIAKDVELSKATLYLYFDNKEELFFAAVLQGTKIMVSMIEEEVEKEETGVNKLAAFSRAYNLFVENYPDYYWAYSYFQSGRFDIEDMVNREYADEVSRQARLYNIVLNSSFSLLNSVSTYAIEIIELRRKMSAIVRDAIKRGIDEGTIRPGINPVETAIMLIMISESVQTIRPDFVKTLESCGINREKFKADFGEFVSYMLLNK